VGQPILAAAAFQAALFAPRTLGFRRANAFSRRRGAQPARRAAVRANVRKRAKAGETTRPTEMQKLQGPFPRGPRYS
jgi:hypothetical protein